MIKEKVIIWSKDDCDSVADTSAEKFALDFLVSDMLNITTSSHLVIDYCRVHISEKTVQDVSLSIRYNEELYTFDKYGKLYFWPKGLCSETYDAALRNIRAASSLHKEKRNGRKVHDTKG